MRSRMEMIYLASDDNAYKAGVGCIAHTDAQTWAMFKDAKRAECPRHQARFLLDYYNRRGDLTHTVFLTAAAFQRITGERVKTEAQYRKLDREYWDKAREEFAAKKAA